MLSTTLVVMLLLAGVASMCFKGARWIPGETQGTNRNWYARAGNTATTNI